MADKFWQGFSLSDAPSCEGKSVLDLGCGRGKRVFDFAARGAREAVGIDPSEPLIVEATKALEGKYRNGVSFLCGTMDCTDKKFDIIISENTLEHVRDVPAFLSSVRDHLNPGGQFYLGFGPLYHAPDGDHAWLRATLPGWPNFIWPWGHLLFERYAMQKLSRQFGRPIQNTWDWPYLDLNRHKLTEYKKMLRSSGMDVLHLKTNLVESYRGRLLAAAARLPLLENYCTLNLFAIMGARQHEA